MKKFFCLITFFVLAVSLHAGVRGQLRKGGKLYNAKKYGSALNVYQNILKENATDQRALFNAANAYYRLNEYTQAEELYKKAAELPGDYAQSSLYNLGNAYYHAGDKDKAVETYRQAILQNPADKEAIHNLQLILQEKQDNQNDNQNNQDNQDNSSDNRQNQNPDNEGQDPQEQNQQPQEGQLNQQDADRVMAMAKESEYKPGAQTGGRQESALEKDW